MVVHCVGQQVPKLRCRVMGAYFEKLGSKSFAVYSIAVTDSENRTWFVKRRYMNFERLHHQLKEIRNYTLHLPPKRIFSSSTEDAFVHQRCIQLDKYLQAFYGDNGSFTYHHGYGYAPYDTYATSLLNLLLNVNVPSNFVSNSGP
ncbi:hypothetical protein ACE6H2_015123 [Prunus campanulata]